MYARIQDDRGLRWQRSIKLPGKGNSFATEVVDNIPDWITADETLMGKYGPFNLRKILHKYCQPLECHLEAPNVLYYLVIRNPEVERVNVSTALTSRSIFLETCLTKQMRKAGGGVDIIRTAYYIRGLELMKLILPF